MDRAFVCLLCLLVIAMLTNVMCTYQGGCHEECNDKKTPNTEGTICDGGHHAAHTSTVMDIRTTTIVSLLVSFLSFFIGCYFGKTCCRPNAPRAPNLTTNAYPLANPTVSLGPSSLPIIAPPTVPTMESSPNHTSNQDSTPDVHSHGCHVVMITKCSWNTGVYHSEANCRYVLRNKTKVLECCEECDRKRPQNQSQPKIDPQMGPTRYNAITQHCMNNKP